MTFSIVAIDMEKKEAGFAIASCCWDAGQVCMARPEGAIASQASGNLKFLPVFFEKLDEGLSPEQIMQHFQSIDEDFQTRQVGMISFLGDKATFTGDRCSYWCGHRTGEDYSCQGNILVGSGIIEAMAAAFEVSEGPLFERLFAALKAADAAGGDARGRQSARLMVSKKGAGQPGTDAAIDITIEDHDNPIAELGRILDVRRNLVEILGYRSSLEKASPEDKAAILEEWLEFMRDKKEPRYMDWWEGLAEGFLKVGDKNGALDAYRTCLEIGPSMAKSLTEGAKAGRFPRDVAEALGLRLHPV